MAIIRCPECNNEVSDLARQCPFCGVDIAGNIIICPDCGKTLLKTTKTCPNCKCDLSNTAPIPAFINSYTDKTNVKQNDKGNSGVNFGQIFRNLFITILIIAAVGGLGYGGYCFYKQYTLTHGVEAAYQALEENESVESLEAFLSTYPESEYTDEIKQRLQTQLTIKNKWDELCNTSEAEDLIAFANQYPKCPFSQLCNEKIDSLEWQNACFINTQDSYLVYLQKHNNGKYHDIATYYTQQSEKNKITDTEKRNVRKVIGTYFNAINYQNFKELETVATSQIIKLQDKDIKSGADFRVKNIYVSKTPEYKDGSFFYIAKFDLEKRVKKNTFEIFCYSVNVSVNTDEQIDKIKFTFIKKKEFSSNYENQSKINEEDDEEENEEGFEPTDNTSLGQEHNNSSETNN